MKLLADLTLEELKELFVSLGEKPFRAEQIFLGVQRGKEIDEISTISAALKQNLKEKGYAATGMRIFRSFRSEIDDTVKFLFSLWDGDMVEGVLMRYKYGNTLCVSTQSSTSLGCSRSWRRFRADRARSLDLKSRVSTSTVKR